MSVTVEVQFRCPRRRVPAAVSLRRWAIAALDGRRDPAQLTVRVVGRSEGQALNRRWRGGSGPTNVLSFPAQGLEDLMPELLGDVVICAPVVVREAAEQGKPLRAHWAHMVVHGTLHLLGYDHQGKEEAAVMEGIETEILTALGYPDPYRGDLHS